MPAAPRPRHHPEHAPFRVSIVITPHRFGSEKRVEGRITSWRDESELKIATRDGGDLEKREDEGDHAILGELAFVLVVQHQQPRGQEHLIHTVSSQRSV